MKMLMSKLEITDQSLKKALLARMAIISFLQLSVNGCVNRTFFKNDVLLFSKTFKGRQGKLTFIINVI